jgi:hypothetical protein
MASTTVLGGVIGQAQTYINRYHGGGRYAQILWVCNRSGLGGGDGSGPDSPLSTVGGTAGALAKLQGYANGGHVILCMPGHTESVSSADYFSATGAASGVAICGLGTGAARATFTWTVAAASWLIDTANVVLDNLRLLTAGPGGGAALTVATPFVVSAAGFEMRNCFVQASVDADELSTETFTVSAGADDMLVEDCRITGASNGLLTSLFHFVGADHLVFRRNYVSVAMATNTDGPLKFRTTASTHVLIQGNYIQSSGTSNETCIDMSTAVAHTGFIDGNRLRNTLDTNLNWIVTTGTANMTLGSNLCVNNNNERGIEEGTASA